MTTRALRLLLVPIVALGLGVASSWADETGHPSAPPQHEHGHDHDHGHGPHDDHDDHDELTPRSFPDEVGRSRPSKSDSKSKSSRPRRIPRVERKVEAPPMAIMGGDVYPVTSEPIPGATVLLRDGRIEAILDPRRRSHAKKIDRLDDEYGRLDVTGLRVYPGLVTAGAPNMGLAAASRAGSSSRALERRPADSYDHGQEALRWATANGVTAGFVSIWPGGARGPLACRGDVLKIQPGDATGVLVREGAAVWGRANSLLSTRGQRQLEKAIEAAREHRKNDRKKRPSQRKSAGHHQAVLDLVNGDIPLYVSPGSPGQVKRMIELAEEHGLRLVFYQCPDAWVFAEDIKRIGASVVQPVRSSGWSKPRGSRRTEVTGGWKFDALKLFRDTGVPLAIVTPIDSIPTWGVAGRDLASLPLEAAFAQRVGLTAQEALEGITIGAARLLGVDDRIGSIEVGKDADVIVVDGDILDYRSLVRRSIVNGQIVYRAETDQTFEHPHCPI